MTIDLADLAASLRDNKGINGKQDIAAIIAILDARFPEAGGVGEDVKEFLQSAYEQKWIQFREPA